VKGTVETVSEPRPALVRAVRLRTSDDVEIVGDLAVPAEPRSAAILCHPDPRYGGNRFNNVVAALFDALPAAGIAALRFDFRAPFSGGPGERLDATAALDDIAAAAPDVPLVAVGYSFGALVALGIDDDRITALGLVAPPLAMAPEPRAPRVPTLVLTPAHDQFSPPAATEPVIAGWPACEHRVVEMADHSLVGHTKAVAELVTAWLSS
jgi:alpha/beta superfamily hydrolase